MDGQRSWRANVIAAAAPRWRRGAGIIIQMLEARPPAEEPATDAAKADLVAARSAHYRRPPPSHESSA